jgi:putative redox protein
MKATTKLVSNNLFETDINGIKVLLDTGSKDRKNQSPPEVLLSALASCSAIDIVDIIEKKRKTVAGLTVHIDAERRTEPFPRIFTSINLLFRLKSPNANLQELEQAVKLSMEKYCTIAGMINKTAELKFSWEIES